MAYVVHSPYTLGMAICEMVQEYYKGSDKGPLLTKAKKEQDARLNRNLGYGHGIALAIAELLTVERSKKFYLWPMTEKVNHWDVTKVLHEQEGKSFVVAFPDGDEASSITDFLFQLIDGDDGQFAKRHEEDRRKKVRSHEINAEPADVEWLSAELAQHDATQRELRDLIMKAEKPSKANDAPVRGA